MVVATVITIRVATLLRYDIWFDELYSVYAASGDLGGLWQAAVADRVHPPGFYLLLWGWLQLVPPTPLGLRILPLLVWLGIVAATWWAAGQAGLDRTPRATAVALVAANPLLFELGAFVRNYGLAVLTTTLVIGAALGVLRREGATRRDAIRLASLATLAGWSHLFAWPVLAALAITFRLRRLRGATLAVSVVPALTMIPWAMALLRANALERDFTENVGWQNPPTALGVLLMPGRILVEQPWWAAWLLGAGAWLLLALALRIRPWQGLSLAVLMPLGLAVAASTAFGVGVFEVRYLTVAAVPFTLLVVMALESTRPPAALAVTTLLLALSTIGIARRAEWRTPWREVTTRLAADAPRAYAFEGFTALPLRYYAAIDGRALEVPEVKSWPLPGTPPGWIVLRPHTLPDSIAVIDQLRAGGFAVVDSFEVGSGRNAVRAWRFAEE